MSCSGSRVARDFAVTGANLGSPGPSARRSTLSLAPVAAAAAGNTVVEVLLCEVGDLH